MIDENFKEAVKRSSDGKFLCRLFRIGSDDGSIHMSISVEEGGRTLYKLPEEYWLGVEELLDWDKDQNILFFTVNRRAKVFIYDVTFMTIVSRDILPSDDLRWDDDRKYWEMLAFYNIIKGDMRRSGVLRNTLALPYASEMGLPNYKILPTDIEHIVLVLKKVEKTLAVQPDLWEIGILDTKTCTWLVEALPYLVKGESSIHFCKHNIMSCYGYTPKEFSVVIFRFDIDEIATKNKVSLFIHDNGQPQSMSWDEPCQWWRAVFDNKVIIPGRFYYDNMYEETVHVKTAPVQDEILELLPESGKMRQRDEATKVEPNNYAPPVDASLSKQESHGFTLPRDQRKPMIISSVFILLSVLLVLWNLYTAGLTLGMTSTVLIISMCLSIALLVAGREVRRNAKDQRKFDIGCWVQWSGIWATLIALASVVSFFYLMMNDLANT